MHRANTFNMTYEATSPSSVYITWVTRKRFTEYNVVISYNKDVYANVTTGIGFTTVSGLIPGLLYKVSITGKTANGDNLTDHFPLLITDSNFYTQVSNIVRNTEYEFSWDAARDAEQYLVKLVSLPSNVVIESQTVEEPTVTFINQTSDIYKIVVLAKAAGIQYSEREAVFNKFGLLSGSVLTSTAALGTHGIIQGAEVYLNPTNAPTAIDQTTEPGSVLLNLDFLGGTYLVSVGKQGMQELPINQLVKEEGDFFKLLDSTGYPNISQGSFTITGNFLPGQPLIYFNGDVLLYADTIPLNSYTVGYENSNFSGEVLFTQIGLETFQYSNEFEYIPGANAPYLFDTNINVEWPTYGENLSGVVSFRVLVNETYPDAINGFEQ